MVDDQRIQALQRMDRRAQKALYDDYAPLMLAICLRYVRHRETAEDVMVEAMYKIMVRIGQYQFKGSFEGWMKRIVVNECLMHLRKKNNFNVHIELDNIDVAQAVTIEDTLAYQDLIDVLNKLPTGYRTVFNLYEIEGYKHREIAEMLDISINTSKSQLILAKKRLRSILKKKRPRAVS